MLQATDGHDFSVEFISCDVLGDVFGPLHEKVAVWLDRDGQGVISTSFPTRRPGNLSHVVDQFAADLRTVRRLPGGNGDAARFAALLDEAAASLDAVNHRTRAANDEETWRIFECSFGSGRRDLIAMKGAGGGDEAADYQNVFGRMWPGLRRMCVLRINDAVAGISQDAMLWMVQKKMNASILILDSKCRVLSANAAARDLLESGEILYDTAHGVRCRSARGTAALQRAVAEIFADDAAVLEPEGALEYVLLLRRRGEDGSEARVPMTLSPYHGGERGGRAVIVMLPMPPEQTRIEALARKMGLTPSEARVAALIRAGHSNREAARLAGLKEQTFNTYAKRALSKMNVTCRAEMAQMLTWQATMERTP